MTTEELIKALREKPSRDNRKLLDKAAERLEKQETEIRRRDYALESIIWYNGRQERLIDLADKLEAAESYYPNPIDVSEWHTEMHCIWMLLVGMFGDWGTSIRSGWIEKTKECAEYIRNLCKDDDEEEEEFTEGDKDGRQKNVHQENNR
jgi:hypothetical protein